MRTKLFIATAIAGSMLLTGVVSGSAEATPTPVLKSNATSGIVTLVDHRGGGGGMNRGGGGGGGMAGMNRSGGGGGSYALRSGGSSHVKRGSMSPGNYGSNDRSYRNRDAFRSGDRNHYASNDRGYRNRDAFKNGDRNHYASNDRDHNNRGNFNNRHRVFRNGAWIWVYGPAIAYGDDCYGLRRQASITGSPYWWSRYNECIGYDYY